MTANKKKISILGLYCVLAIFSISEWLHIIYKIYRHET